MGKVNRPSTAPAFDVAALTTLVFDLDGVIWRGDTVIPGAAQSIARLRELGLSCFFATNNSSRPPQFFAQKLQNMDIQAATEEIVTSATATALYIERHFSPGARVFIVGEEGLALALEAKGARATTDLNVESVDVVVAGIDRSFTYEKLKTAQRLILKGAKFLATNRDATFPVEGGVVPGSGSIVAAVETASGTVPVSMGKPEPGMLQLILESRGLSPHVAAMIGDRLDTDIACAHRAGIGKIFVATGVNSMESARAATGELTPDLLLDDLPQLVALLEAKRAGGASS